MRNLLGLAACAISTMSALVLERKLKLQRRPCGSLNHTERQGEGQTRVVALLGYKVQKWRGTSCHSKRPTVLPLQLSQSAALHLLN